jgi:hypothetical protein
VTWPSGESFTLIPGELTTYWLPEKAQRHDAPMNTTAKKQRESCLNLMTSISALGDKPSLGLTVTIGEVKSPANGE